MLRVVLAMLPFLIALKAVPALVPNNADRCGIAWQLLTLGTILVD